MPTPIPQRSLGNPATHLQENSRASGVPFENPYIPREPHHQLWQISSNQLPENFSRPANFRRRRVCSPPVPRVSNQSRNCLNRSENLTPVPPSIEPKVVSKGSGYFPQLQSSEDAIAANSPVVEDSDGEDWITICDEDKKEQDIYVKKKSRRSRHRTHNQAQTYETLDRSTSRGSVPSLTENRKLNTKRSLFQIGKDLVKTFGQLSTTDTDPLDNPGTFQSVLSLSLHRGASSCGQIFKRARNVDFDTGSDNHDQGPTARCKGSPAQVDSDVLGFKSNRYSQLPPPVLNNEYCNSQLQLDPKKIWAKSRAGIDSFRNIFKGRKSSSGVEETQQEKKIKKLDRKARKLKEAKEKQARIAEDFRLREEFRIREGRKLRDLSFTTQTGLNFGELRPPQRPPQRPSYTVPSRYHPRPRSTETRVVPRQRLSAQFGRAVLPGGEIPRQRLNGQSGRSVLHILPGQRLSSQFGRAVPPSREILPRRRLSSQFRRAVPPSREIPGQRLNDQFGRAVHPSREIPPRRRLSAQFRGGACPNRRLFDLLSCDETRQHREAGRFRGPRGELIQYDAEHPLPGNSGFPAIQYSRIKPPAKYFGLSFSQQAEIEREGAGSTLEPTEAQIADDREKTYQLLVGEEDFSGQTLETFFG